MNTLKIRLCLECEADISHRGTAAKRCEDCAAKRRREAGAQWYTEHPEKRREVSRECNARWRAKNPDKAREKAARWYAKDIGKRREYAAQRRAENPERIRETDARRYAKNPKKKREAAARWRAEHPEKARKIYARRRVRELTQLGEVTRGIQTILRKRQNSRCAAPGCGVKLTKSNEHLDHIVPLSKGGMHTDENFQLLCAHCNQTKGAKAPLDFARERGFLV